MSGDVWFGPAKSGGVGAWFGPGLPDLPVKGGSTIALRITHDTMPLETGNRVVATARFSEHAAAAGNSAWIVSTYPTWLFTASVSESGPTFGLPPGDGGAVPVACSRVGPGSSGTAKASPGVRPGGRVAGGPRGRPRSPPPRPRSR